MISKPASWIHVRSLAVIVIAFLAPLDAAAVAQVQALPFVRWLGPDQPAYKVAPDADYKSSGPIKGLGYQSTVTFTFTSAFTMTYLPLVMVSKDQISNGDFESGRDGSWTEYSSNSYPLIVQQLAPLVVPHSGSWAAWLGGVPNEVSSITQQVTLPAGNSTLTYYYWGASLDTTCGNDFGQVKVGSTLVDTINLCDSANTRAWVMRTLNLSAYAGQSVSLQFYAQTNGSLNSSLFIDDVALGDQTQP